MKAEPQSRVDMNEPWDQSWSSLIMAHVRRIVEKADDVLWERRDVLMYWGGLASIVAGVLWCLLFVALQLQLYDVDMPILDLPAIRDLYLLAPMLLLAIALVGLYSWVISRPSLLARTGLTLAIMGAVSIGMASVADWQFDLIQDRKGFVNYFGPWLPITWFYELNFARLLLFSVGLLLLIAAGVRQGRLSHQDSLFPVAGHVLAIVLFPILRLLGPSIYEVVNKVFGWNPLDPMLLPVLLLGAAWMYLGYVLWSKGARETQKAAIRAEMST